MSELTQQRLRELLDYDPATGVFRWRKTYSKAKAGEVAGTTKGQKGYRKIGVCGEVHGAHRLAFLYMEGKFPVEVDHINRKRADNRWINLRSVTCRENQLNRGLRSNSTTGIAGVCWRAGRGKWRVRINDKHHGNYSDFFEACCARKSLEIRHGFHPNYGREV